MKRLTFKGILKKTIYKNRNALYDLVPPEGLVGRIGERNDLVMELSPILMNSPVSSIFVYGTPGTGKTATTTQIADELRKEASSMEIDLKSIYINCSENRTEYAILTEMLSQISTETVPKLGWSTKKVLGELKNSLKETKSQVLVVLDEVDYLLKESGDNALYWLSRINTGTDAKVSSLVISNDLRVYDYLSPRTQSSFGRVKIVFSPYSAPELKAILANRSSKAFVPRTVSPAALKKIADTEAQRGGDARKALEILDSCAKLALAQSKKSIGIDLVDEADKNLEQDQLIKTVTGLTKHQKMLYLTLLKQSNGCLGPEVFREYTKECKGFKVPSLSERRIRSFLILFNELGLIHSEVGWVAHLKKKSRKINLNLDDAVRARVRKKVRDSI